MFDNKLFIKNRNGQVFVIGIVIVVTFALISALVILGYLYDDKTEDEHIGTYQSGMVDAIIQGDKVMLYIDELSKPVTRDALIRFLDNGGIYINDEATDSGEESEIMKYDCGFYVYNLWNSVSKNCFPNSESFSRYLEDEFYSSISKSNADINFQRKVEYDTYFEGKMSGSTIHAIAKGKYDFSVYKNDNYKNDPNVQQYINEKIESVSPQGDIKVTCSSGECFLQVAEFYYEKFGPDGLQCSYSNHRPTNPYQPRTDNSGKSVACTFDCSGWVYWIGSHAGIPGLTKQLTAYEYMVTADNMVASGEAEYICGDDTRFLTPKGSVSDCTTVSGVPCKKDSTGQIIYFRSVKNKVPCTKDIIEKYAQPGDIIFANALNKADRGKYHAGHIEFYAGNGEIIHDGNPKSGLIKLPIRGMQKTTGQAGWIIAIYRFKYVPGGVTSLNIMAPKPVVCQTANNDKWDVVSTKLPGKSIDSKNSMDITISVNNKGDCASILSAPKITMLRNNKNVCEFYGSKCEFWPYQAESTNIIRTTSNNPYIDLYPITCTFSTDKAVVDSEQAKGNCVLLAPKDSSDITYVITGHAKDVKGREVIKYVENRISVSKPSEGQGSYHTSQSTINNGNQNNNQNSGNTQVTQGTNNNPSGTLSTQDQKKFDDTKNNLNQQNIFGAINAYSKKYSIPTEVLLGKITVETQAQARHANSCNSYGACGISQVVYKIHGKNGGTIHKACGKFYTQQEFINDKDCQINAGAYILKDYYNIYGKKGVNIPSCLKTSTQTKYYGWEAALRAYNGLGKDVMACNDPLDQHLYVSDVMRFAQEWGYTGVDTIKEQQKIPLTEINQKGVIGTYSIYPSFNVNTPFDLSLIDKLSEFMEYTVNACRTSNETKEVCLQMHIDEFNSKISKKYVDSGIFVDLSKYCEEDNHTEEFYRYIESVENCAASSDIECQCELDRTYDDIKATIQRLEGYTLFTYKDKDNNIHEVRSYNSFVDQNNKLIEKKELSLIYSPIMKKKDYMKTGYYVSNQCTSQKSMFRMCLNTGYTVPYSFGSNVLEKNVTLKFAITIRDNIPPIPVSNVQIIDKKHSSQSVIVSFDKNPEGDVAKYLIYLGNSVQDFSTETVQLKKNLHYRTLLTGGYAEFKDIDLMQDPKCELTIGVDGPYCNFKYTAKVKDGTATEIILMEDKLYYIIDKNKFFYIINGSDQYNGLVPKAEKFIAVTAVDIDNNEIDNVAAGSLIEMGKNLNSIFVEDDSETGFISINTPVLTKISTFDRISLSWNKPKIYLDGTKISTSEQFQYNIYIIDSGCSEYTLCETTNVAPARIYSSNTENALISVPSVSGVSSYIIVVSGKGKNGKEYPYGLARIAR